MRQFIVTHQNCSAAREPSQSALHHPTTRRVLLFLVLIKFLFADAANVRHIAELSNSGFTCWIVVAFVQAQMLRLSLSWFGSLNDNGIQRES